MSEGNERPEAAALPAPPSVEQITTRAINLLDGLTARVEALESLNERRWKGLQESTERWSQAFDDMNVRVCDLAGTMGKAGTASDALSAVLLAIVSAEVNPKSRRALATRIAAKLEEAAAVKAIFPPLKEKFQELAAAARTLTVVTKK